MGHGNIYRENKNLMFGRNRWVEYAPAAGMDYEGAMIPANGLDGYTTKLMNHQLQNLLLIILGSVDTTSMIQELQKHLFLTRQQSQKLKHGFPQKRTKTFLLEEFTYILYQMLHIRID